MGDRPNTKSKQIATEDGIDHPDAVQVLTATAAAKASEIAQQLAGGRVSMSIMPAPSGTLDADTAIVLSAHYGAMVPEIVHALHMAGVEAIAAYTATAPVLAATDDDVQERLDGSRGCWVFHRLDVDEDGGDR